MKITVSQPMAKKLEDAGFNKKAYLYWLSNGRKEWYVIDEDNWQVLEDEYGSCTKWRDTAHIAAPTAEEIVAQLPLNISHKGKVGSLKMKIDERGGGYGSKPENNWKKRFYEYGYTDSVTGVCARGVRDESLANAAAEMWIYLKENNLLN